ncbi:MAG: hypothetical protein JNL28_09565 [Planctomycetes bacterium]|nr:hypothetical protein [Planctomycetota bacterium]
MLRLSPALPVLSMCLIWTVPAQAQGSDDCASATAISGTGTFAIDTSGATDSPQQSNSCPTAHADVWFAWTATATQTFSVSSCGGTGADTVIAVYSGSACPVSGTQLACNDDACAQQSTVLFNATIGNNYLIQIGDWSPGVTFSGTFALAPAVNPCGLSVGPDVITGDITSIQNSTASNGLDAFTLGTTSCNVGSALVSWQGPNQLHPVISETAYKYKIVNGAGRFEMIGIGWLKHGFAASTGSTCCPCQNPGNNQFLGLGCSDPYSASQAGAQSTLTPRWEVNPHTGVFPYPGSNPPWSGTTARRTEIALADLEPSGGTTRYFAECTYITQDDAQAGNGNNNASYKELVVTGGPANYTFATTGVVARMQPALMAWRMIDSGVKISSAQIAGDGLIFVGSRATSLGGGQYHYEFAVHNMNADRAVGSFTVPLPPGANLTNVGFHGVTYRNGDGFGNVSQSSTDWPATIGSGDITWACDSQAQDANANAIRWQATYNFRFDADVAPQTGTVTFGLWKPGTPAQATVAAEVPARGATITAACFGDGLGSACPCANQSAPGANVGCLNSLVTGGALSWSGTASVSADTFVLDGSGMPNGAALYFQGTALAGGGSGVAFGDGLYCAGGVVTRLFVKSNSSGASQCPELGDASISILGTAGIGAARVYQCWYRDAAAFCTTATFNLTNAIQATWQP